MRRRAATITLAASIALGLTLILATASAAAGPTRLNQGTVSPTAGTTTTVFAYSVHYLGNTTTGETAISVTAVASDGSTTRTTSLSLNAGGTALNGTWSGSSTLPPGSWTVTFKSITSLGTNPPLTYATPIMVNAPTPVPTPVPPPPTPGPTPRPTVRPTPRPTAVPATATPLPGVSVPPVPTPFGTTITNPSNSPGDSGTVSSSGEASPSPSASAAESVSPPGRRPFNVPVEGVVAIGLLGAVTVAAALGERRRRQAVAAFRAGLATSDEPWAAAADDDGGVAGSDQVDDETVATIDYDGLDDRPDA